jgi:capsular exopolysaccharide synthesis family protein
VLYIFVAFTALSVLIVNSLSPRYTAELSIALNMKSSGGEVTDNLSGGIVSKDLEEIGTAINTITSPGTVRQVVNKLDLQDDPEFDPLLKNTAGGALARLGVVDYVPNMMRSIIWRTKQSFTPSPELKLGMAVPIVTKHLSVVNDGKSYTINLTFTAASAGKAASIANAFGEWYVEYRKDRRSRQLDQISTLLIEKSDVLRRRVLASEAAVEAYRQKHGIVSLVNDNTLGIDTLTKLNTEAISARAAAADAEANLREMQNFSENESREAAAMVVGNAPNLITLLDQQHQLKTDLAAASESYKESHPTIVALKSRLAEVTSQLSTETDRVLGSLRARVQVARSNSAQIEAKLKQLTAEGRQSVQDRSELAQFESQRDADKTIYQTYLENAGRVGIEASAQVFDAEITSPAVAPIWPSFPQWGLLLGLSIACAAMLAIGLSILLDSLRRGVRTVEELAGVRRVQILGMVPRCGKRNDGAHWSLSTSAIEEPLGVHAEAIRSIGVSLLTGPDKAERKVVLITSALPGEGKTSLVLSLGRLAAAAGKSTLVMECDLRRSAMQRSQPREQLGLVDVLTGKSALDAAIKVDPASGLRYLCAGSKALYPAELLDSEAMDSVFESARTLFDLVLVDTPPLAVVSDALVLSARADATIIVVRSGKTDKRAYLMALDRLLQFGTAVTGVVLSHVAPQEFLKYCSKRQINGYFSYSKA